MKESIKEALQIFLAIICFMIIAIVIAGVVCLLIFLFLSSSQGKNFIEIVSSKLIFNWIGFFMSVALFFSLLAYLQIRIDE